MTEYRKARCNELPQIIQFINMVFSLSGTPLDFPTLLPKLYKDGRMTEPYHYLAVEDGQIKAAVCSFPITLRFGGRSLTCATIGSVSVHPDSRGKGYMKQLMNDAMGDMKKNRYDLSCLSGLRHRYRYFGYELCGSIMTYRFSRDSLRHCKSMFPDYGICLREVIEASDPVWKDIHQLHGSSAFHSDRSFSDFKDIADSWHKKTFAFFHDGVFAGYLSASGNTICELLTVDDSMIYSCLNAYFKEIPDQDLFLEAYPHEASRMDYLSPLYERWQSKQDDNYRFFNYESVLDFYMRLKAASEPLADGNVILSIQNSGNYLLTVNGSIPSISRTDQTSRWQLSETDAARFLFSPDYHPMRSQMIQEARINWFPLPLSMCCLDKC